MAAVMNELPGEIRLETHLRAVPLSDISPALTGSLTASELLNDLKNDRGLDIEAGFQDQHSQFQGIIDDYHAHTAVDLTNFNALYSNADEIIPAETAEEARLARVINNMRALQDRGRVRTTIANMAAQTDKALVNSWMDEASGTVSRWQQQPKPEQPVDLESHSRYRHARALGRSAFSSTVEKSKSIIERATPKIAITAHALGRVAVTGMIILGVTSLVASGGRLRSGYEDASGLKTKRAGAIERVIGKLASPSAGENFTPNATREVEPETPATTLVAERPEAAISLTEIAAGALANVQEAERKAAEVPSVSAETEEERFLQATQLMTGGGIFTSNYGWRGAPYNRMHYGIDIANEEGTPIKIGVAGRVSEVGWDEKGWGNYTVVQHGNGYITLYAHQSQIDVELGQRVEAGQVIGLMGNTGGSDGTHLHFEVRKNGKPEDPYSFIIKYVFAGGK